MLVQIAAFELRYQLRSPLFAVSFVIFLAFGFAVVASPYHIAASGNVYVNSPYAILQTVGVLSNLSLFIIPAFVANVVIRDPQTRFDLILFAIPLGRRDYLSGRFLGAVTVALLLLAAVPLGMMAGSWMPWLDPQTLGPFTAWHYLYALLVFALPNVVICSAILFAIATLTGSMMWTYLGVLAYFLLHLVATIALSDPAYDRVTALMDPFGVMAFNFVTRYWTAAESNSQLPPLVGLLLEARLLWATLAAALLGAAYARFRLEVGRGSRAKRRAAGLAASAPSAHPRAWEPVRRRRDEAPHPWSAFAALTRFEVLNLTKSPVFIVLLIVGAMNALADLLETAAQNDVRYFPVTRATIAAIQSGFTIFPVLIALYYAGEVVWREREWRIQDMVDTCAAPSWARLAAKMLGVGLVLLATLLAEVLVAMLFQLSHGYTQLEPLHYLLWLLLPETIYLWQLTALAVCVQCLVPHKALGWAIMLIFIAIMLSPALPALGFEHGLYRYAYIPPLPLSDMNGSSMGMDRFWIARTWFELYWSAVALGLGVLAVLLWPRGNEQRLMPRLGSAWRELHGWPGGVMAVAALVWVGSGAVIYYNTCILNDYPGHTARGEEHYLAAYEKALLGYETVPQPKIVAVTLDVQLEPRLARADTTGSYVLENRTGVPLPELHVRWPQGLQMQRLDAGPATLSQDYPQFHYRIYRLATPMAPGERRIVRFATRLQERGFPNGMPLTRIVENGTFIDNREISPQIGMSRQGLLRDRATRRRNGLPEQLTAPALEDTRASAHGYLRADSDWVNAQISVTTDADQTPLAPGDVVKDVQAHGRHTVVTRSRAPILHFFSIQSARYSVAREQWTSRGTTGGTGGTGPAGRKVELAVYYHPAHVHNIRRMLDALKASLDVYSERFAPYPFDYARIVEVPAYWSDAQPFAGTIPFSESLGFVQDFDERHSGSNIDLATYVTAHEAAHQWWLQQVMGAYQQGDTLLSETFAQYSALLVMEKLYGREQIHKFLRGELNRYLRARAVDGTQELPLFRVEDQPYIDHRKGAVVMYWLKEVVGEDAVDRALRRLLDRYAFKGAPYPSTTDFLALLRQEAPGHEQEIADLFERISLYDLKADEASVKRRADGRYEVSFTVECAKRYADGQGNETEAPLDETVTVGAFEVAPGAAAYDKDSVILLKRMSIKSGRQTLTLVLDKRPKLLGIDPFNERIDRNPEDNVVPVTNGPD